VETDHGNPSPLVTIDAGGRHLEEHAHVHGINRIGVRLGAGNNTVRTAMGSYAVYDIAVECGNGSDRVDLTGFQGAATVQAGSGNVFGPGGSPRGLELIGGSGSSTYEVDGNGVQVRAEGSPAALFVYVNGQALPQTKITGTTFRQLLIQGQSGTNPIILGPLGGFSFPDLIVHAGPGNKVLDASALPQRVTLLGGSGNCTLVGGSGPNYLQGGPGGNTFKNFKFTDTVIGGSGNDRYETFDSGLTHSNWTFDILARGYLDDATF